MPARSVVSPVSYASRPPQVSLVSGQPMSAATCSGIARTTGLLAIDAPLRGVKPDAAARNRSSHVEERDPHVGQIDRAAGTSDAGKGDAVLGRDHGCHLSRIRSRDLDCYTTAPHRTALVGPVGGGRFDDGRNLWRRGDAKAHLTGAAWRRQTLKAEPSAGGHDKQGHRYRDGTCSSTSLRLAVAARHADHTASTSTHLPRTSADSYRADMHSDQHVAGIVDPRSADPLWVRHTTGHGGQLSHAGPAPGSAHNYAGGAGDSQWVPIRLRYTGRGVNSEHRHGM